MAHPQRLTPTKCRKRSRNVSKWKRTVQQTARYTAKGLPEYPKCNHLSGAFQCKTLQMKQIKKFHEQFYAVSKKQAQDVLVLKYCKSVSAKRKRPTKGSRKPKAYQLKFNVPTAFGLLPVCQQAFLKILGISRRRVDTVMRQFETTGKSPKESRGGDRKTKKYRQKKVSLINFIKKLKCSESHYCRGKSMERRYLSPDSNISKLFRMYNEHSTPELKVKKTLFHDIFRRNFNLGFGTPLTDACSECLSLTEKIKAEQDNDKRSTLLIALRVHKLRAKTFFSLVKEKREDLITFCFDCQKNLALPRIPDQKTYYSRQLYLYNFTVTRGSSKDKLGPDNAFAYVWTEDEFAKNSNLISSAVHHRLCNTNFDGKNVVRLIADGCSGQNKNSMLIAAVSSWLQKEAPENIKTVEIVFPVTGHSFIPPDRVFGNIEKRIRKHSTIDNPTKYKDLISEFATVIQVGSDQCQVLDYKTANQEIFKKPASGK